MRFGQHHFEEDCKARKAYVHVSLVSLHFGCISDIVD